MRFSNSNKHLPKAGQDLLYCLKNHLRKRTVTRPVQTSSYIPRFSENDYVANGWIKFEPDVISLVPANNEEDVSPKSHSRAWSTHSTRTQPPYVSNPGVPLLIFVFWQPIEIWWSLLNLVHRPSINPLELRTPVEPQLSHRPLIMKWSLVSNLFDQWRQTHDMHSFSSARQRSNFQSAIISD